MVKKAEKEITFGQGREGGDSIQLAEVEGFSYTVPSVDDIYDLRDDAKNVIYGFARNFQGYYASGLKDEPIPIEDATIVSKEAFLRFFKTASLVWDTCEKAKENTPWPHKDKNLEEVKDSVSEDAARVGEAIILSIAAKIADEDNGFNRLLTNFNTITMLENHAEAEEDRATLAYAQTVGQSPAQQFDEIGQMASAGEEESTLEEQRVGMMKKIFKTVSPVLKEHGLLDPIKEFVRTEWLTDED